MVGFKWAFDYAAVFCLGFFMVEFLTDGFVLVGVAVLVFLLYFMLSPLLEIYGVLFGGDSG